MRETQDRFCTFHHNIDTYVYTLRKKIFDALANAKRHPESLSPYRLPLACEGAPRHLPLLLPLLLTVVRSAGRFSLKALLLLSFSSPSNHLFHSIQPSANHRFAMDQPPHTSITSLLPFSSGNPPFWSTPIPLHPVHSFLMATYPLSAVWLDSLRLKVHTSNQQILLSMAVQRAFDWNQLVLCACRLGICFSFPFSAGH